MKYYDLYADLKKYAGKIPASNDVPAEAEVFAAASGDKNCYHQTETIPHAQAVNAVAYGQIGGIDMEVISLIATFRFLTFKQLDNLLTLRQRAHNEKTLKSSVERLFKHNMLRISHFSKNKELCVYSLDNYGDEIASVLDVQHSFSPMQVALPAVDIMRMLEQNNVWIEFVKSGLSLSFLRRGEVISLKTNKSVGVRPSLGVGIDNETLFFEVVRRGESWKAELLEKIKRYKILMDNWSNTTWELQNEPLIIINGEDEAHNRQICHITSEAGLEVVFYTEDRFLSGEQFYHSIYRIVQGEQEFFCFGQKAA